MSKKIVSGIPEIFFRIFFAKLYMLAQKAKKIGWFLAKLQITVFRNFPVFWKIFFRISLVELYMIAENAKKIGLFWAKLQIPVFRNFPEFRKIFFRISLLKLYMIAQNAKKIGCYWTKLQIPVFRYKFRKNIPETKFRKSEFTGSIYRKTRFFRYIRLLYRFQTETKTGLIYSIRKRRWLATI